MVSRRNRKANHVPLIIEPHPEDYNGYSFITLIKFREITYLTTIDNATEKAISAFVLDLCGPEEIDEEYVIAVIAEWHEAHCEQYPLSIEFSKRGMANDMSKIHRSFNIDFVTRVIGPMPKFNMTENNSVRRRRKKAVPSGVEVHNLVTF